MTPTLMQLIAEWRAAHPKAWPYGLDTAIYGFTMHGAEFELRFALALIADAVLAEILQRDDVMEVTIFPPDDEGIRVGITRYGPSCYGEAATYPHALLLAERAMRGAT